MTSPTLPQQIVLEGTNLFALAARLYGDATLANILAQANGMTDPFPQGVVTLAIPAPNAGQTGGLSRP